MADRFYLPSTLEMPIDTRTGVGDAAARGQIRAWKTELAKRYRIAEQRLDDRSIQKLVRAVLHKHGIGHVRAKRKLCQFMAPSKASWENCVIGPKFIMCYWALLHPGETLVRDADPKTGLTQNCVTVDFAIAVVDGERRKFHTSTGIWSLSVQDHALGRIIQRAKLPLSQVILEAHHNLLGLRDAQFDHALAHLDIGNDGRGRFLVAAGPGAFAFHQITGHLADGSEIKHLIADTWIHEDQLYAWQTPLRPDGQDGQRLFEKRLFPAISNSNPCEFIYRAEKPRAA
jgi:hypothetical protein